MYLQERQGTEPKGIRRAWSFKVSVSSPGEWREVGALGTSHYIPLERPSARRSVICLTSPKAENYMRVCQKSKLIVSGLVMDDLAGGSYLFSLSQLYGDLVSFFCGVSLCSGQIHSSSSSSTTDSKAIVILVKKQC